MTRRFELNLVVLLTEMMRCDASWINREHDNVGSVLHISGKVNERGCDKRHRGGYPAISLTSQSVGVIASDNPSSSSLRITSYLLLNRLELLIRTATQVPAALAANFEDDRDM